MAPLVQEARQFLSPLQAHHVSNFNKVSGLVAVLASREEISGSNPGVGRHFSSNILRKELFALIILCDKRICKGKRLNVYTFAVVTSERLTALYNI